MEASGWFDDLVDVAVPALQKYGPSIAAGLGSFI
jgi:hypothetical protein